MKKKAKESSCWTTLSKDLSCCKIESLISVDERGQMVLPKEIRDKTNIRAGDKLAVISLGTGKETCCICLIKAEELAEMAKNMLGPMLGELNKK